MITSETPAPESKGRDLVRAFVEAPAVQRFIVGVIIANAVIIGLETSPAAMEAAGTALFILDAVALAIFVTEIGLKLYAYRLGFFRSGWNTFDFVVVAVALIPSGGGLSVLRALRILRTLRLISAIPKLRLVVQALLNSLPSMGTVFVLLGLVFYVFAVMATKLFGGQFPEWFGTIGRSLFSLFQIMTLESWSMGIVRPVMVAYPNAWLFFVPFILTTTFAVLNLFIAIIVNSMQKAAHEDHESTDNEIRRLTKEVAALRHQVSLIHASVAAPDGPPTDHRAGQPSG